MRGTFLLYLLFCINETFGGEDSMREKSSSLPSTTSGKQLKIIRDILNQESLARFSMIQKIQTLVIDALDSKNLSQALEKRLSDVVKELGELKINDDILQEENIRLKEKIKDLYSILSNYTTVESANVQSLNDSEILYLKRKTLFLENECQTLSLQNLDINKQLVFLMKKDLNSLKNETFALNQKYDILLQEIYAFQNQSLMNGRKYAHVVERLLSMENGLQTLLKSWNKPTENNHQKAIGLQTSWIGVSDIFKEKKFVRMSDAEVLTHINWANGQPDNHKNNENCVEILSNGKWNDLNCSERNGFICKLSGK